MATNEQVRMMQRAQPFRPFRVKMAAGQSFTVRHPENIACDVKGRGMTIYDDEGMHMVEMLLVEVIEPVATEAGANGS